LSSSDFKPLGPVSSVDPLPRIAPTAALARLLPNVPNPFNPGTMIRFEVPGSAPVAVDLAVYDLRGRLVRTLVTGRTRPGLHEIHWNGRSDAGMRVAAGTYFSRLIWNGRTTTRPLSLVK